jgi:Cd2+/Zn2+-exporting ATPase
MDLTPPEAVVRRDGQETRVGVDEVRVAEILLVKPGEKIPLDGVVVAGTSPVNQAPITGESLPVEKTRGDDVFAGTINGYGALDIRVTHLRQDTTLARIIALVEMAQAQRAPSQAFVERFAHYYTPAVIALAVLIAVVPPFVLGQPLGTWFYRALVLLVISCPVRAGDFHACVSRVGDRDRRAQGCAHQGRRASGADRRGALRCLRQDRNTDERRAPCRRSHPAERHRAR